MVEGSKVVDKPSKVKSDISYALVKTLLFLLMTSATVINGVGTPLQSVL